MLSNVDMFITEKMVVQMCPSRKDNNKAKQKGDKTPANVTLI